MSFGGIITQAAGKGKFFCGGEMFLSCFLRGEPAGRPRLRTRRGVSSVSLRLTAPSAEGAFWGSRVCGRGQRALRSPFGNLRPIAPQTIWYPTLAGRGGSVSRRDHNPQTKKRAHVAWARNSKRATTPIPSYSSGEGVWGRGASLREAASPPESPNIHFFGREREGGAS